jgi:RNA-dependent RNA polymerase
MADAYTVSPAFRGKGKPPAFMDMSDGCGFANIAALALAAKYHRSGTVPTAIQMRFGGAKGLLLRHPDPLENANTKPRIRLRPSQIKILVCPTPALPWKTHDHNYF